LRTFFGKKWLASGPSRNFPGFLRVVDHFWSRRIALALKTGTRMGPRISRSIVVASGVRLWVVDDFPRRVSFYFAAPMSIEAHE
jgi:signal transduction histidine kinase